MSFPPGQSYSKNMEAVGYHDLQGKPGFKLALHKVGERFFSTVGFAAALPASANATIMANAP